MTTIFGKFTFCLSQRVCRAAGAGLGYQTRIAKGFAMGSSVRGFMAARTSAGTQWSGTDARRRACRFVAHTLAGRNAVHSLAHAVDRL